jgi:hypothetical protein
MVINFYFYYFIIILVSIFISNGIESLFRTTSQVIKYHNYPDILKISTKIYKSHNIITKFINAGYSGIICLFQFKFIILLIYLYKFKNNTNLINLKYILIFQYYYILFIILNGLNILNLYKNDYFIGHKILYFCIPSITLIHLLIF